MSRGTDISPSHPWEPGLVLSGYTVDRYLGRGGWAHVYEAEHAEHGTVALKVLDDAHTEHHAEAERFTREAELLRRVEHPNVVRAVELGHAFGQTFLALELLHGEDLDSVSTRTGQLPLAAALELTRQTVCALIGVHAAGIVHRDLKPANVLLDLNGERRRAVLIDFGIARGGVGKLTETGIVMGTPHYLAPEQLCGTECHDDPRVDVYAAGVFLYELLAGKAPFEGMTVSELVIAVVSRPAPPITDARPDVPDCVAALIADAIERDPEARIPSASTLLQRIETVMDEIGLAAGDHHLAALEVHPSVTLPLDLRLLSHRRVPSLVPDVLHPPLTDRRLGIAASLTVAFALIVALSLSVADPLLIQPTLAATPSPPEIESPLHVESPPQIMPGLDTLEAGVAAPPIVEQRSDRSAPRRERVALDADPAEDVASLLGQARIAHVRGHVSRAYELYRRASTAAPNSGLAWRGRGLVALQMGDASDAQLALNRYLRLEPHSPDAERIRRQVQEL